MAKFDQIRQDLESLGYTQKLHPECVPLVSKLLDDLKVTTTNLQKYMRISQHALEERDILESGAEPYKCDNAKLIKECNDLHLAFIHFKEQHEKIQRELRNQIAALQIRLENCNLEKCKLINQIQELEKEKFRKASRSKLLSEQGMGKENKKSFEINSALACADEKISRLNKELKELKEKHLKLLEDNSTFQNQVTVRDEEIKRLQSLIDGGRSYSTINKDCCYKNVDSQVGVLQDEITRLKRDKTDLHLQVKEALARQHEAMRRALHLAERNKQLEKEMKDIDEIALAVETECNNTVKGNSEKVARLQDRVNESLILIQNLERDNAKLKQTKLELSADLDAIKLEKIHIQKQLEFEIDDKKRLTDKINNFNIIENDLNLEIDRLTRLNAEQKRKIIELESQIPSHLIVGSSRKTFEKETFIEKTPLELYREEEEMSNKGPQVDAKITTKRKVVHKKSCKKAGKSKSPTKKEPKENVEALEKESVSKCCCETGVCIKNLKELLDREIEFRQTHALQSQEALQNEKDYYMKEYHKLLEQVRNVPTQDSSDKSVWDVKQQLKEKENRIKELEDEIQKLKKETVYVLHSREEQGRDNCCRNPACKRREREMEIIRDDLKHIEMENNSLKTKLQNLNQTTVFNEERMKKAFQDMEEHIRKLENERRDLVKSEVTQRSNISHLEEEYKIVKDQLRETQNELNNQKANYNQLKLLHEQTDRALSDAQNQALRAESELANYQSRAKDSSRDTAHYEKEIAKLTADVQIMKNQLSKLDKEKDDLLNHLDEKTERVVHLEEQIKTKDRTISTLEMELKDLRRKLSKYADEASSHEQLASSRQQDLAMLERDYEKERRLKESVLQENKRLQNDLTSVTVDCRAARNELELAKRQVEDLKRQLQQYVAEVKRTEDLISHKELERNELLDQFRSLSQEANILETTNHTLENEATQSRIQLSVALDHSTELERRVENQEAIIGSYEKQISELTSQVASLEIQLKQYNMEKEHYTAELNQMRDLCVKLDKDKDSLKHELFSKGNARSQVDKTSEKLITEKENLQQALERERDNLEGVEKLLNDARQEVIDQRLLNQDLQREIEKLKIEIDKLRERLATATEQVDVYQGKALEYSQLNKQLRREMANERFSKSRSSDSRGYYPSL